MDRADDAVRFGRQEAIEQMLAFNGIGLGTTNASPFCPYPRKSDQWSGLIDGEPLRRLARFGVRVLAER